MKQKIEIINLLIIKIYDHINNKQYNNISILYIMLLLFLGVSKKKELLDIFNHFKRYQLGIFEEDVFLYLKKEAPTKYLESFIKNKRLLKYSIETEEYVNTIINFLLEKNLIKKGVNELIEIHYGWNLYGITKSFNIVDINKELILIEEGNFS